jgi:hypothetical protein
MLLTDRLGVAVLDAHSQRVGTVGDVRLAAPHDPHQQTMTQLLGVIVSPRTRSSYLGYERSDADAPWAAALAAPRYLPCALATSETMLTPLAAARGGNGGSAGQQTCAGLVVEVRCAQVVCSLSRVWWRRQPWTVRGIRRDRRGGGTDTDYRHQTGGAAAGGVPALHDARRLGGGVTVLKAARIRPRGPASRWPTTSVRP